MTMNTKYLALLAALLLPASVFAQECVNTFTIHKDWDQEGDTKDIPVNAFLSCTGADTTQIPVTFTATTDAILFVYDICLAQGNVDCTITETVPANYTADYDVDSCDSAQCLDSDNSFVGCKFIDIDSGGAHECDITNTPDPATVEVSKSWVVEGADQGFDGDYEIWLACDSEVTGPGGEYSFDGTWYAYFEGNAEDGDEDLTFTVLNPNYPYTGCYVNEENDDSVVETTNSCASQLKLGAGGEASCDIVNTVFFEGIPTLNQYGMAILALLMLGVGFVGFRRFV